LVALAISALVLVALYGAVVRAAAARERTARTADRITKARTVLLRMAGEVEGALVPGAPGAPERFVVVAPDEGKPAWSELRLASAAGDDVRLVAYRIEAAASGPGVLVRREGRRFAPPHAPEPAGAAALVGVRTFRVRCFDGGEWKAAWTAPALPRAVELALGVEDGAGGVLELTTAVTLALGGTS
jgi:type II secretory pathway component PulJ